jgi:hypothetical protein
LEVMKNCFTSGALTFLTIIGITQTERFCFRNRYFRDQHNNI